MEKYQLDPYCTVCGSSPCHGTGRLGFPLSFQTTVELERLWKKGGKRTVVWRPNASVGFSFSTCCHR